MNSQDRPSGSLASVRSGGAGPDGVTTFGGDSGGMEAADGRACYPEPPAGEEGCCADSPEPPTDTGKCWTDSPEPPAGKEGGFMAQAEP